MARTNQNNNVSAEQAIINEVVRTSITPERVAAIAARMGPKIEQLISDKITDSVESLIEELDFNQFIIEDEEIMDLMANGIRVTFGLAPKKGVGKSLERSW